MAYGLPVVTTDFVGRARELGEPGCEYILVNDSPGDIAEGWRDVLGDRNRRSTLIHAARSMVERDHDLRITLDRYADLYRRLAT